MSPLRFLGRRTHVVTSWRGPGRLATAILEVLGGSGPFCRFLLLPARPPRRRLLLCGLFKDARTGADSRCVLAERLAAVESRPQRGVGVAARRFRGPGPGPAGAFLPALFRHGSSGRAPSSPRSLPRSRDPPPPTFSGDLPCSQQTALRLRAEKQRSREESPGAAGGWGARFYPGSVTQRLLWNRSEAFCPKASTRRPQCGAA